MNSIRFEHLPVMRITIDRKKHLEALMAAYLQRILNGGVL